VEIYFVAAAQGPVTLVVAPLGAKVWKERCTMNVEPYTSVPSNHHLTHVTFRGRTKSLLRFWIVPLLFVRRKRRRSHGGPQHR
jgi:hypothetical protein